MKRNEFAKEKKKTDFKIVKYQSGKPENTVRKQRLWRKSENENESEGQESAFFLYYLLKW